MNFARWVDDPHGTAAFRGTLALVDSALFANLTWSLAVLVHAAIVITALIVIPRGRKPTAAMAWILLIVILPGLGVVLYLVIGSFRLPA